MSLWKSNRSIRCQLLPSKARTFQDWEKGRRNRNLRSIFLQKLSTHTYKMYTETSTDKHTDTCTHTHTLLINTDSPVRPGHSDRVSPHPERRRFWKTDRGGLETLFPAARSLLFTSDSALNPKPASAKQSLYIQHIAVSESANIVFDCQQKRCVYPVSRKGMFIQSGVLTRRHIISF